jgi:hypothetical protein
MLMILCPLKLAACSEERKILDAGQPVADQRISVDTAIQNDLRAHDMRYFLDQSNKDSKLTFDSTVSCKSMAGSATIKGSVQGQTITASYSSAMRMIALGNSYWIAFTNQAGNCSLHWNPGTVVALGIQLCDNKPGTYSVNGTCHPDGGGGGVSIVNSVRIPDPGLNDKKATSGSITIESLDFTCGGKVKGSFAADFSGDAVSGAFDTIGCGSK